MFEPNFKQGISFRFVASRRVFRDTPRIAAVCAGVRNFGSVEASLSFEFILLLAVVCM